MKLTVINQYGKVIKVFESDLYLKNAQRAGVWFRRSQYKAMRLSTFPSTVLSITGVKSEYPNNVVWVIMTPLQ